MVSRDEEAGAHVADLKQAEGTFRSLVSSIMDIASGNASSMLFPNGITHVKAELKVGEVELRIDLCGSGASNRQDELSGHSAFVTKRARIKFESNGEGVLEFSGNSYACLGSPRHDYPTDLTVTGTIDQDKFRTKYSNEFQVTMQFALLIWGQRGIYVHLGPDNLADNDGPSAGCIHLGDGHAQEFYNWVDGPTRIQIEYPW